MLLAALLMLTACNSQSEGSLIKIDKQDEQFAKMQQELDDLKTIEVKYIPRERMEKFQKIIYKHYFRRNDDKKHQEATIDKNEDGTEHTIIYNTKDIYQLMEWGETYIYYNGTVFGEEQYYKKTGKDYCYEPTEEAVIQKEIKKLFERLGLPYGDRKKMRKKQESEHNLSDSCFFYNFPLHFSLYVLFVVLTVTPGNQT